MAICHFAVKVIGKGGGKSSVAAAAYRAGAKLYERDAAALAAYRSGQALEGEGGRCHNYEKKGRAHVRHVEILAPENAPAWMTQDRERLWNSVQAVERRKDAQLCREVQVALPRELSREEHIDMVRSFANQNFVSRGMVADVALHYPKGRDGQEQPHAHIMLTMREVDPASATGFGKKERSWNSHDLVPEWRKDWAETASWYLERSGSRERVDHRSLKEQAAEALANRDFQRLAQVDREPQPKLGKDGALFREVAARNAERAAMYERIGKLGDKARDAFLSVRERFGDALQAGRERLGLTRERAPEPERHQPATWLDRHVPVYHHKPKERGHELEIG